MFLRLKDTWEVNGRKRYWGTLSTTWLFTSRPRLNRPSSCYGCLLLLLILLGLQPTYGQWVNESRSGWLDVSLFHHDTRSQFGVDREKIQFVEEGHAVTSSVFVTAAYGLIQGLDTWVILPVHRLQFDDIVGDRTSLGFGDPRIHLRIGPALFGLRDAPPIAIRGGLKMPGGSFPVDAEIIPIGEGQRDWEIMLELGRSFYPRPFYAAGWVGYRWRDENSKIGRKPGNERFFFAQLGGQHGRFVWTFAVEAMSGLPPEVFGLELVTAQREMLQLLPYVGWDIGLGTLKLGGRFPLAGRNLPAGPALTLGYFSRFRW